MLKNYFLIGWRNLVRAAGFSLINIFGLAAGMSIALLIGLWIHDETSFNKSFQHYDRLTQVYHNIVFGEEEMTIGGIPYPMGAALKSNYAEFEEVCMSSDVGNHILADGDTKLTESGIFVDPSFLKMFSVNVQEGTGDALKEIHSIMLSETLAQKLFGEHAMGKMLKFDNQEQLLVTGVFDNFPPNSHFAEVQMLVPLEYMFASSPAQAKLRDSWESFELSCFTLLNPGVKADDVSSKIASLLFDKASSDARAIKPKGFLFPMEKWHLHINFEDGGHAPARIRFVWMFGTIGVFVLILACINFMNLSTARSEMRSKEVGIRKVMGSVRRQLIRQFLAESMLVVLLSFLIALLVSWMLLPLFNDLAGKQIVFPWRAPQFYLLSFSFILITALFAGSYPALILSSFNPIQVLKGAFKAGRYAAVPRKVMVVFQFTISILLIIGTVVVFMEIQHAKDRPVGFDRAGIIHMAIRTKDLADADYNILRSELISSAAVVNMAKSDFPITGAAAADASITWEGKDPDFRPLIAMNGCSHDFPAANGFQFVDGRDFSRDFATDSVAVVVNEMAADLFGRDKALGMKLKFGPGKERQIVGIIKDQIRWTPFSKQSPHMYYVSYSMMGFFTIRLNTAMPTAEALKKVEEIIHRHDPNSPFDYKFQDEDYAKLFSNEERIGKLAAVFSVLAIAISCVGIFGLAAFAASQRIKEIGIRKVLGASVFKLWSMLSLEFVWLVLLAIAIAFPLAYYLTGQWLSQYDYRVDISWGIFGLTAGLALFVTLATVSYQALRAASMNPVNSLRND
jgi:putative ABC transport system permease protein